MLRTICSAVLLLHVAAFSVPSSASAPIDVFLLPHAHCDVGWLKTVDGYFDDQVTHILSTVTDALAADPSRRFIWSEIKWLQLWWPNQTEETKQKFRDIVKSGQLEFAGAGWSQNDEVTPTYSDIIDNQMTGHEYLRRIGMQDICPQPGRCVRFGWQIDMFAGFSGATPSLWALAGYDGMFSRWEGTASQRATFVEEKSFEFLWDASASLTPNRSRIWAHVINGNYGDLAGFQCGQNDTGHSWIKPDIPCTPETEGLSFMWPDAIPVNSTNVATYADMLASFAKFRHVYQGPQLAVWGSDYAFTDAPTMFANMDKIMAQINSDPEKYGVRIQYTTLAQYADYVHSLDLSFPVKSYPLDFEKGWPHQWNLSLANNFTTQYQTGAATSRAELKQTTRAVSAHHRAAEATVALAALEGHISPKTAVSTAAEMFPAWDALGILQHHDALTGTMSTEGSFPWGSVDEACVIGDMKICKPCTDDKCRVLEDYMNRLSDAQTVSVRANVMAVSALVNTSASNLRETQSGQSPSVIVSNPLSASRRVLVSADLPTSLIPTGRDGPLPIVLNANGSKVPAQLDVNGRRVYWIAEIGPFGWHEFRFVHPATLSSIAADSPTVWPRAMVPTSAGNFSNGVLALEYSETGRVVAVNHGASRTTLAQDYMVYQTRFGGPYCLVEEGEAVSLNENAPTVRHVDGPLFSEVLSTRQWGESETGLLAVSVRLTRGTSDDAVLTLEHTIPVIPWNHEVIYRIHTDLDTESILHDDSGFELYPSEPDQNLPISGRYHTAVLSAALREAAPNGRQLTFLNRHTKGVASLRKGEFEYMMIRRINGTDDQGPWPLNETTPLSFTVGLLVGETDAVEPERLRLAHARDNAPVILYRDGPSRPGRPVGNPMGQLPESVVALSFSLRQQEQVDNTDTDGLTAVIRLQNVGDTPQSVNLSTVMRSDKFRIKSCTEMTLTLQQARAKSSRLHWRADSGSVLNAAVRGDEVTEECERFTISKLDIRTILLTFEPKPWPQ